MPSANRALLASSLLLCAVACAAIALLTIASSATEQLARLPVLASSSSISALEARVEADSKAAAAKDAGAKSLQAQLIKSAQAAQASPTRQGGSREQSQLKRAEAVQESLAKIAQDHPASLPRNLAGRLVASVKADDAKVQGAMSALHNALLPPAAPAAVPAVHVVDQKKVEESLQDLTKIALELHLKQLEAKQRALHPEPSQPQQFVQHGQQPLAIHAPGQHMPRAVAEIAKAAAAVPLPHAKTLSSPSDSADAILHRAIDNVAKEAMKLQPAAQHPAPLAANSAVGAPSSPSAAASAILKAALSLAQHRAPKTDLSVPFAPLKAQHAVGIDSHALALAIANAAKFDSRLKADSADVAAAAASASEHKKPGGYRIKRGDIERALNRAVAFENQMEQMIVDEKADAEKQQQLQPKSAATSDKLALVQKEKNAQVAAISSALEQAKHRAASYALRLKTLDEMHSDLNAQRAAAASKAAQKREADAVAHAVAAAAAAKAAALRADKAQASVPHAPHAPTMPQAVSHHPAWHLADAETPIARVKSAEAAATAARAAVVAAEAAAADKARDVAAAEQHLVAADHAAEQAQAAAAASLAKEYEKKLLEAAKGKAVAAKDQGKGVVVEKAKATPKESELQMAEDALQKILKRQEELDKQKV